MTRTYAELMAEEPAHIVLRLETQQPIELTDFVAAFASLSSQYDKFLRTNFADLDPEAQIYVKEIRPGSIVADLLPVVATALPPLMDEVQKAAVTQFIKHLAERISDYFKGGKAKDATKSDINDFLGTLQAVANDPNGNSTIEAAVFHDGKKEITAAFKFTTSEARKGRDQLERHRQELEHRTAADHQRVLMIFTQTNIKDPALGKRTGERVVIEVIAARDMPLIYASNLAEQAIKTHIRDEDENVFKKGFVVDVNVELRGGKAVAYRVTHLHQVIDLPDDD